MTYVDGFVMPVKKSDLAKYRKAANLGKRVWLESGALDYKECVADELNMLVPDETGRGTKRIPSLFPKLVKAKRGETVIFSFIVYRSKAHRNAVNKKVFANPNMADFDPADMPVDMKRMATAGFKTIVEGKARTARLGRPKRGQRRSTKPAWVEAPAPVGF